MSTAITRLIAEEGLPEDYRETVDRCWRPLSEKIAERAVGSSRVDLQACKLEYSIVSPK